MIRVATFASVLSGNNAGFKGAEMLEVFRMDELSKELSVLSL